MTTPSYRRYGVAAAAFVIQGVIIGSMFAYGVFFKSLEMELGWSRTLLSASTSVSFIVMGTLAMLGGRLNDRFGPRWVMSVSGVCFGLGYGLMYYMDTPWQLFVCYGLLVGVGLSTHDVVTLSTVARWFDARRGLMTGVVKVGTACGQMVIPLSATALIAWFDWRTACAVLGASAAIILVLAAQFMRQKPNGVHQSHRASAHAVMAPRGLSLSNARRTRAFWTLCAIQFTFMPSLVTVPLHITVHGMDLGLKAASAASLLSVIGGSSIAGRLLIGTTVDRFGGRPALALCLGALFVSLICLRLADLPWMLFGFAAIYGFAHGGLFTVASPTVAELFGTAAHGAIFGVILFFGTIGAAIGPLYAGWIFDTSGSYNLAFNTLAILALIGLFLVASLRPVPGPEHESAMAT